MVDIFISYHHRATRHVSARIAERLEAHFGQGSVFRDVERITVGAAFDKRIQDALSESRVPLAIIGDGWPGRDAPHESRLRDEADVLRQELAYCIQHEKPVVPVLVDDAQMPTEDQLPEPLRDLARRQATPLRDGDFEYDMAGVWPLRGPAADPGRGDQPHAGRRGLAAPGPGAGAAPAPARPAA